MNKSRREFMKAALLGISSLAFTTGGQIISKKEKFELPNIIIIFPDDQGYSDLVSYGAEGLITPNLDCLAAQGMRFTDFYVSQAVCSASRASLMTGCYAERVGIQGALMPWSKIGLNPGEQILAELLKNRGYKTAIFGKWHLGHHPQFLPLQQGFDHYFGLPYSNDMWPVGYDGKAITKKNSSQYPWQHHCPPLPLYEGNKKVAVIGSLEDQAQLTTRYTQRALQFIEANKNGPFFLYLAHSMPHVPLGVSEKFKGRSKKGLYGDVMMEIDWSVGQIMDALKKNGLEEKTLVIYASDNGPWLNFGNHAGSAFPLSEGKLTSWEGGVRVPCLMWWPKHIPRGTVCNQLASSIDILPTLAAIVGAPLPKNKIDGVNILPLMEGKPGACPRDHFFYYYQGELRAVRQGKWKLVFPHESLSYAGVPPGKDGFPGPTKKRFLSLTLYNLERDIAETKNLVGQYPRVVSQLKLLAEKARSELGDTLTNRQGKSVRPPGVVQLKNE